MSAVPPPPSPPSQAPAYVSPPAERVWPLVVILMLAAFGVGVGLLMAWHHDSYLYGGVREELIGCAESEGVSCDIVNTSAWSEVLTIPLGIWAVVAFGTTGVVAVQALLGDKSARFGLAAAGTIACMASAFLFYQSKIELGYVCLWCIRLYITSGLLFVASLAALPRGLQPGNTFAKVAGITGAAAVSLLVVFAGGERVYRSSLIGVVPDALVASDQHAAVTSADPKGPAPTLSFTVTTEDNAQKTFTLDEDDAWRGKADAKVAVVEFADLECGYCKRESAEINRLYAAYGDRVLFVWKHFPMNPDCNSGVNNKKHRDACRAAVASVCAKDQGKFWQYADLAFKNQHQLGDEYLRTYAQTVGMDVGKFDVCVRDPKTLAVVKHDAEAGKSLSIHGTPRIFINGQLYRSGSSAEIMARAIETALGASAADANHAAMSLHDADTMQASIPPDVPPMQLIALGDKPFRIDTFEAGIVDGKAISQKHVVPGIRVNWNEAKAACAASGKRLCTEQEWVSACQNALAVDENHNGEYADDMIEGTAYPYGDYHDDGRCWDGHEADATLADPWRPVYTGEMPACVTPTGVYDMTGNVEEWVGDSADHAVLLGGSFDTSEDHARCYRRNDTFGAGYASIRAGFRCCAD
jgi:protein-disulfide isomerase